MEARRGAGIGYPAWGCGDRNKVLALRNSLLGGQDKRPSNYSLGSMGRDYRVLWGHKQKTLWRRGSSGKVARLLLLSSMGRTGRGCTAQGESVALRDHPFVMNSGLLWLS